MKHSAAILLAAALAGCEPATDLGPEPQREDPSELDELPDTPPEVDEDQAGEGDGTGVGSGVPSVGPSVDDEGTGETGPTSCTDEDMARLSACVRRETAIRGHGRCVGECDKIEDSCRVSVCSYECSKIQADAAEDCELAYPLCGGVLKADRSWRQSSCYRECLDSYHECLDSTGCAESCGPSFTSCAKACSA